MVDKDYLLGENTPKSPGIVDALIAEFRDGIVTLEFRMKLPFVLLQDGKSQAYYVECHIQASIAIPLIDLDATLDPEEQEQFRLQRELQPNNPVFLRMCSDAIENRHFSDVIAEYDYSYRPEIPLKVLGGQHRVEAIKRAFENNSISRYHGFRIYFGLSVDQRNEIAQIANTNIAISPDLIDRMQGTANIYLSFIQGNYGCTTLLIKLCCQLKTTVIMLKNCLPISLFIEICDHLTAFPIWGNCNSMSSTKNL
jgi:hypothetical protein